jgi:branched-chain amino acid transport system permease protein
MSEALASAAAAGPRGNARRPRAMQLFTWLFFAGALAFAAVAALLNDEFYFRLATEALIFGGLALAVDVLLGRTGLLPLGHALFFGFGAYVAGLVLKHWAASFWLAIGVVFASALVAGVIGGIIAIRARGVYFALISFGLAQVVAKIVFNTRELGASDGIIGIPVLRIGLGPFALDTAHAPTMFLLTLVYIGMLFAVTTWLMETPFGRLLSAVKANEHRVPFLGFDPWRVKLGGFTYSAIVAALAGALYPVLRGFVSPELLFFQVSVNAVINVIVGGTGTLIGPLYGTALLTGLRSVVGSYTEHHLIVIGLLFMASVIFFPRGLIGYSAPALQRWLDRRRRAP